MVGGRGGWWEERVVITREGRWPLQSVFGTLARVSVVYMVESWTPPSFFPPPPGPCKNVRHVQDSRFREIAIGQGGS